MRSLIDSYTDDFTSLLPETAKMLKEGMLSVHDAVGSVALHGTRGLKGGYRADSDIDLSLLVKDEWLRGKSTQEQDSLLQEIVTATLDSWKGAVELDLALVFDIMGCGLQCFDERQFKKELCINHTDCFGLFKVQKGFSGRVAKIGLNTEMMYPAVIIWRERRS
ncbi:MAG: hypothetical protein AB9903_21910 [Vulcanimicrobiota bacterium]